MNNDLNTITFDIHYDESYDGGGIELSDNHMQKAVISEDIVFYGNHNVFTENEGVSLLLRNQLYKFAYHFDDQVIAKVYGNDGIHSHTFCLDWRGEHSNILNWNRSRDCNNKVIMQILNKKSIMVEIGLMWCTYCGVVIR